jgi:ACS family hexuronate transporter-like MFS transporter
MAFWVFMYDAPQKSRFVNQAELNYIQQDKREETALEQMKPAEEEEKIPFRKCFTYKRLGLCFRKIYDDGVWWFFLFWTPSYLFSQFEIKTTDGLGKALIFTLYAVVTILSIYGGKLPTIFINRTGANPYAARMKAMLIFAFFPLCVLFAQPLGSYFSDTLGRNAAWIPILLISIGCAGIKAGRRILYDRKRHVPQRRRRFDCRNRGHGGGVGSLILQKSAGKLFYSCGSNQHAVSGF